jgi:cytochrome c biogenesis protein CcdA/thiol-disulfide isomerase/thioredoxin
MEILILFAFLGGLVTIVSPCILPVLPVVLSGSVAGGKARPIGIVSGFVASFTLFTLALTYLVRTIGISADAIRNVAVGIIIILGLVMVVPRFHEWFGLAAARITGLVGKHKSEEVPAQVSRSRLSAYAGGVIMGFGLGLIWTPCVGPIMASVISLALTENLDRGAIFITLAYSLGTAIPMLGIMLGGRALLHRVPMLLRNTMSIQKVFGILIVVTGIAIGFGWDRKLQAAILQVAPEYGSGLTAFENAAPVQKSLEMRSIRTDLAARTDDKQSGTAKGLLKDYGPAPEFVTHGRWFNTERYAAGTMSSMKEGSPPLSMRMLRGKVVLVDFWTYSCVNCVRTIPHLRSWYRKYGLVIIGVHTPEFEFEKNPENVRKAIADLGVTWPVVLDNDYAQWRAYNNHYWPAHYFIDARGHIRHTHFGEGEYEESEHVIQALLKEAGSSVTTTADTGEQSIQSRTPETYLGYMRAQGFAGTTPPARDKPADYSAERLPGNGEWNLSGKWTIAGEYILPITKGTLQLGFDAKNVFLVIQPETPGGKIEIKVDGLRSNDTPDVRNGILMPKESRLYQLVALKTPGLHVLNLAVSGKLRLFAFTFG